MKDAACRGHEDLTANWYADTNTVQYQRAVKVCHGCPVRQQCLDEALRTDEPFGIWGGLGARERSRLLRQTTRHGALLIRGF